MCQVGLERAIEHHTGAYFPAAFFVLQTQVPGAIRQFRERSAVTPIGLVLHDHLAIQFGARYVYEL
jgi:hypothetical protein